MGSASLKIGDRTIGFKRATLCSSAANIHMIISAITTLCPLCFHFIPKTHSKSITSPYSKNLSNLGANFPLKEIGSSKKKLAQMEKEFLGCDNVDLSRSNIANELKIFLQYHQLPLGKESKTRITEMVASISHSCEKSADLLSQYMNYRASGPGPGDWSVAQKLILRAGEPFPRRRCLAKSVLKENLHPFPNSLWKPVGNKTVKWSSLNYNPLRLMFNLPFKW